MNILNWGFWERVISNLREACGRMNRKRGYFGKFRQFRRRAIRFP